MKNYFFLLCLSFSTLLSSSVFAATTTEQNKKLVRDFYEMAFNQHQPRRAMDQFVGVEYKQHNPFVLDGKKPFIDYFEGLFKKSTASSTDIKRVLADGDLVVVHTHSKSGPSDLGRAVIDIFRVANGKIVEHWDVAQPVPDKSANTNTMF